MPPKDQKRSNFIELYKNRAHTDPYSSASLAGQSPSPWMAQRRRATTLAAGVAAVATNFATGGAHTVQAVYSGENPSSPQQERRPVFLPDVLR